MSTALRAFSWRRAVRVVAGVLLFGAGALDASAQERWSNPTTWGGQLPAAGAHVVVPQGRRIVLDVSPPPLGSLTIDGVLAFGDTDLQLAVGWIMVHGLLEIGTEQEPYRHRATVTLTGPLDDNVMGMGARFIGAMGGGALEIHGSRREDVDWAVLSAPLRPGDTTLRLELVEPHKTALGWQPGDLLAIASSSRDPFEAEAVTVTAVSGLDVSFTPPVRFPHTGELDTIAGRIVDQRAEVGLLTRNIVIQSAPDGITRQLGGHIMIMAGSIGKLEGVELRHMGQMGRLGRYPIHWHLTGVAPADYARFNSIWNSFHRAIAVHQTHGVEIRGNVAANVWSHTFVVAEDGNETHNVVEHNLGILTRRVPDTAFVLKGPTDPAAHGPAGQDEWRPATFWVNNPNNIVRYNRAAGGLDAIGFFYDRDHGRASPIDREALTFAGNVAHSYAATNADPDPLPDLVSGLGLLVRMEPRSITTFFRDFQAHHNAVAGAWLEESGDVLQDAVLVDNPSGAVVFRSLLDRAFIAATTSPAPTGIRLIAHGSEKAPRVRHATFVNLGAAVTVESGAVMPGNVFEAITRIATPLPVMLRDRRIDHGWMGAVDDADGTLSGAGHAVWITGLATGPQSTFMPGWGTFGAGGAFMTPPSTNDAPSRLSATVDGWRVALAWYPAAGSVDSYILEAGTRPGATDVLRAELGSATSVTFDGVPHGRYVVRLRARSGGTLSEPSNEVRLVVGEPPCFVPDSPAPLTVARTSNEVTLRWIGARAATGYLLGVGASPDRYSLILPLDARATSFSALAPAGVYFVRIVAAGACGLGVPSNELMIEVP